MKLFHGTNRIFDQFEPRFYGSNYRMGNYRGLYATPYERKAEFWAGTGGTESKIVLSFEIDDKAILYGDALVSSHMDAARLCQLFSTIASQFKEYTLQAYHLLEGNTPDSPFIKRLLDYEMIKENQDGGLDGVVGRMFGDRDNLKPEPDCKYKARNIAGVLVEELGFAGMYHETYGERDMQAVIFDLSKISEVTLVGCTRDLWEKYHLENGQIMIGAGNQPLSESVRPTSRVAANTQTPKENLG